MIRGGIGFWQDGDILEVDIVRGKRRFTPDTALRPARNFGMSADFWPGLQMDCNLDMAEDETADRIRREVQVYGAC